MLSARSDVRSRRLAGMHGEFKVPGGKLVVVDLELDGDPARIAHFHLSGDFFIEPGEALDDVRRAVEGLPASSTNEQIARAIHQAVGPEVAFVGFSPEAVATAVRRAIGQATGWRDHDWQLIRTEPLPPCVHLALDEVLTRAVGDGRIKPTLRIWNWNSPAVVIGSFQSVRNEVDMEAAQRFDIPVVRRVSGGGAMFMEAGNVVTWSLYAPAELVAGMSFEDSYRYLDAWAVDALRELGVDAWYQGLNDITSAGGKIGGAAQKRLANGGILHHVTMSYDIDADRMTQVLRIGREKLSDKGIASAKKRVDPLKAQTGLEREQIIDHMVDVFRREHGLSDSALRDEDLAAAQQLVTDKFATDEWLYRLP